MEIGKEEGVVRSWGSLGTQSQKLLKRVVLIEGFMKMEAKCEWRWKSSIELEERMFY